MRNLFARKKAPPDTPEDKSLARRFEWRVDLSRLALVGERVWEALLWPFIVLAAFLILSMFDLWSALPPLSAPRPARGLRRGAARLARAAHPLPHADAGRGAQAPRAPCRYQASAGLLLRGQARHHITRRHRTSLGGASRAAEPPGRQAQAELALAAHRPQRPLCHPFGTPARAHRGAARCRSQSVGSHRRGLHPRRAHVGGADAPRRLGDAAGLYRSGTHRSRRRQRAGRRRQ